MNIHQIQGSSYNFARRLVLFNPFHRVKHNHPKICRNYPLTENLLNRKSGGRALSHEKVRESLVQKQISGMERINLLPMIPSHTLLSIFRRLYSSSLITFVVLLLEYLCSAFLIQIISRRVLFSVFHILVKISVNKFIKEKSQKRKRFNLGDSFSKLKQYLK